MARLSTGQTQKISLIIDVGSLIWMWDAQNWFMFFFPTCKQVVIECSKMIYSLKRTLHVTDRIASPVLITLAVTKGSLWIKIDVVINTTDTKCCGSCLGELNCMSINHQWHSLKKWRLKKKKLIYLAITVKECWYIKEACKKAVINTLNKESFL